MNVGKVACNRRVWLGNTAILAAGLASLRAARGRESQATPALITQQTKDAIRRGIAFLTKGQNDDGSFGGGPMGRNVAVCSLCGLALLSTGHLPGRGMYGSHLKRAQAYVLSCAQPSGFLHLPEATSHGPMYEHGFATLFLAEAYGLSNNSELRERLVLAVKLIVEKQNQEGGWRYWPERNDADLSVTICQVMALRAARNAGIYVPNETIERCVEYVRQCQNADGGFNYMLGQPGQSRFPRSAAGVVALYSAGIYKGDEIERGLNYLLQYQPGKNRGNAEEYYFYGHYYAIQAMWHAGGEYWSNWYPAIQEQLIGRQREDGMWFDQVSPAYGTAMACLILQTPVSCLPIFQK